MPPTPSNLPAIGLMLLAVLMFALMDAGLKLLAAHYPPLQVATLRGLASLPLVMIWILATVSLRSLLQVYWRLHLVRGALGIAMMFGFVYGLRSMPMSSAYSIAFIAPLLVTAMAVPLLGEKVGPRRWTAIAIGLVGVIVILRPTGQGMATAGGLAVLLASICYAIGAITVRLLAQRDSIQAMVFWFLVILSLGAGMLAMPQWVSIRAADAWTIAGVGLTGSLAQVALTEAFRRGEASLIAPFEYTALVWTIGLDLTLWGILPDNMTWLGAGIIVASGFYLLRREKIRMPPEHP